MKSSENLNNKLRKNINGSFIQSASNNNDLYIVGNPQISFFKVVYRRHTNFTIDTVKQFITGYYELHPTNNTKCNVVISRDGDLLKNVYVVSHDSNITNGSKIINTVELEIGGKIICKKTQEWMDIENELTTPGSKLRGFKSMLNNVGNTLNETLFPNTIETTQIPLNFWFCKSPGQALPLIAIQTQPVVLNFTWGIGNDVGTNASLEVHADYIHLDVDEKRRFSTISHEYLIEQVQVQQASNKTSTILNFFQPVKEIIWTSNLVNTYGRAKLTIDGEDRFSSQPEEYFQLRQTYDYHTTIPFQNITTTPLDTVNNTSIINNTITSQLIFAHNDLSKTVNDDVGTSNSTPTEGIPLNNTLASPAGRDTFSIGRVININDEPKRYKQVLPTNENNESKPDYYFFSADEKHKFNELSIGDTLLFTVFGEQTLGNRLSYDGVNYTSTSTTKSINIISKIIDIDKGIETPTITTNEAIIKEGVAIGLRLSVPIYNKINNNNPNDADTHFGRNSSAGIPTMRQSAGLINISSIYKLDTDGYNVTKLSKKINCYSFSLKPEDPMPSGACNFSNIKTVKLVTDSPLTNADNIYAINYNVLRIISGKCDKVF